MSQFRSHIDEQNAISFMISELNEKSGISDQKVNQIHSIDEAYKILELRREVLDAEGADSASWNLDEIELLKRHMVIGLSGIDPDERVYVDSAQGREAPENWSPTDVFYWSQWRRLSEEPLKKANGEPLGYSPNGELLLAMIPPGGGATVHTYKAVPESITWELTEIEQRGIKFLIGKAKVCEINAVSSVPSLPEELTSAETGKRVCDRDLAKDEWQRRVDSKRIDQIAEFINIDGNVIANSALLFSPEGQDAIRTTENGKVTIDFSKFLKNHDGLWFDEWWDDAESEVSADLRPMWLIDGQHRTRGLAQSEIGSEMQIPIIMFTDSFSLNQSAKVFAEINTLQRKLAPLHTLFMQHRFMIPQRGGKRDFKKWDVGDPDTWDSRQNNLSYECAGWLSKHEGGPLYNRIKILEANQPRLTIIKANSWVDYSRYWFNESGPYPHDCLESKETIFQEVENYFQAFVNICNHDEWPDGEPRWVLGSKNKGLMQMHSTSRVLLDVYKTVWEIAVDGYDSPIPVSRFEEVLKPLYWVDWRDADLLGAYHGSGEVPRTALRIWVKEAILNGEMYGYDDVMAEDKKSMPGKGILSPPKDSTITIVTEHGWPIEEKGGEVILTSPYPKHALATSRWTVISVDENGNKKERSPTGGAKVQAKASLGIASYKFKWENWVNTAKSVIVSVQWSNVNRPNARTEIILTKPDEDE